MHMLLLVRIVVNFRPRPVRRQRLVRYACGIRIVVPVAATETGFPLPLPPPSHHSLYVFTNMIVVKMMINMTRWADTKRTQRRCCFRFGIGRAAGFFQIHNAVLLNPHGFGFKCA